MQKWQEKQRQKVHQSIVQNAKSSFKRYSNSRQKSMNASRARQGSYPSNINKTHIPINKILQIFQLQKYGSLLGSYKFMQNLVLLQNINEESSYIKQITQQVQYDDRQRFQSLLHTLFVMSKNLRNTERLKKKQYSRQSIQYPPHPPQSTSSNSYNTPSSMPKNYKSQSKFRIKMKGNTNNTPKIQGKNIQNQYNKYMKQKQAEVLSDKTKRRRKSISHGVPVKGKGRDDSTIIHHFQLNSKSGEGELRLIQQNNKIIRKLAQKLQHIQSTHKSGQYKEDINLQLDKIKEMYLSFDSATLTSNINNIDLQQLTYCFSMQIISIMASHQIQDITKTNQDKIKSLLRQSFIVVKQEERQSRTQFDSIHQSNQQNVNPENAQGINQFDQAKKYSVFPQQNQITQEICPTENEQNLQIKLNEDQGNRGLASSIWGNNYIASVINDFSCFDNIFVGQSFQAQPKSEDVKNFVDLVMMAGKMQKQIPILAYVYITRLLKQVKGAKITRKNWRNIASKIWDDRSLQNHSFSKVIHPYTTLQLNRLQKYLLFFIDYQLNINQREYSESYFCLRKYSNTPIHTINLVKLDLKTIKKLQSIQNCQNNLKVEKKLFMRKCMDKSF